MTKQIADSKSDFKYIPKVIYEFTINPNDQYQFVNKKDSRLRNIKDTIDSIIQDSTCKFNLFPEISMPQYGNKTNKRIARYHYHGILLFVDWSDIRTFLSNTWHKLTACGSIQFNEYRPDHWPTYCRKQQSMFGAHEKIKNASWNAIIKMRITDDTASGHDTPGGASHPSAADR